MYTKFLINDEQNKIIWLKSPTSEFIANVNLFLINLKLKLFIGVDSSAPLTPKKHNCAYARLKVQPLALTERFVARYVVNCCSKKVPRCRAGRRIRSFICPALVEFLIAFIVNCSQDEV